MGFGGFLKKIAAPAVGLGAGIATMNPAVGLAAAGAVNSAFKQGEANDLQQEGLDITRRDIADRQPLRDEFTRRSLAPVAGPLDLSEAFTSSGSGSNVFSNPNPVSLANLAPPASGTGGSAASVPSLPQRQAHRRDLPEEEIDRLARLGIA